MTDESLGDPVDRLAAVNEIMMEMSGEECVDHTYNTFLGSKDSDLVNFNLIYNILRRPLSFGPAASRQLSSPRLPDAGERCRADFCITPVAEGPATHFRRRNCSPSQALVG